MTREEAENKLYLLWEDGEIPSNFTTEHTEYERAVRLMMKTGEFDETEFY
ncbi:hypothetical protein SAMN06265371_106199 [Lutibacter agarilyticus]|uniref:Uncharacterized protein n=1 Tax=Lutibacter agarilyticus TaxID=1109740 RepID=A0A238XQ66_9FLAO|nr:hypothetical protein [Lutibacter agarilyticus]SNR60494.1 hypothetical protein SAMN06265371_106199 [Lutibacter agarilyticus]